MLISLVLFAATAVILATSGGTGPMIVALVVWGWTFGGASALLNTAVADAAVPDTDIAATLISTVWNGAIFGGSAIGGLLLISGARSLAWTALPLLIICLVVATLARDHTYRPGPRHAEAG